MRRPVMYRGARLTCSATAQENLTSAPGDRLCACVSWGTEEKGLTSGKADMKGEPPATEDLFI